jgi:hypothetical protein
MNNSLPPAHHPDFAEAMGLHRALLPPTRPSMFDHLAAGGSNAAASYLSASAASAAFPLISALGPYRGYADAIMGGRYAAAAAAATELAALADPLLPSLSLSQELRHYGGPTMMLDGSGDDLGNLGIGVGQYHQHQLQVSLLLEEKLHRLRHEQNRYLEEERAYIALRDQLGAQQQQQQQQQAAQDEFFLADSIDRRIAALQEHLAQQRLAAAAAGGAAGGLGSLGRAAAEAYGGGVYADAQQLQLAEEAAATRETLAHKRVLEEEAARRQLQGQQQHEQQRQFGQQEYPAILENGDGHGGLRGSGAGGDVASIHSHSMASAAAAASTAASDKFARLLQLKQLSDEDLIRRAAEVQQDVALREGLLVPMSGAGRAAATTAAAATALADPILERQLLEAHLLRSSGGVGGGVGGLLRFQPGGAGRAGGAAAAMAALAAERSSRGTGDDRHHRLDLDLIRQAYVDVALSRRSLDHGGEGPIPPPENIGNNFWPGGHPAVATDAIHSQPSNMLQQHQHHQPLRYFKNGMEVDVEGNPLPITNSGSGGVTSMSMGGSAAKGSTATSRFLATVMRRVPEIGPALAVLQPEEGDPALVAGEFQSVVESVAMVLRSVQERCARLTDDVSIDLQRRIAACIASIEANSADLGLGAPAGARVGVGRLGSVLPGSALAPPPPPVAAAGLLPPGAAMRYAHLLRVGIDPNTYQMLLSSNNHRLDLAGGGAVAAGGGGMVQYPSPEEQLAMAHHRQQQQAGAILSQSGVLQEGNVAYAPLKKNNHVPRRDVAKSKSPVDENMPMMTMYKSEKKAAKKAMKAEKRKRKPKLVHKANTPLKTFNPTPKKLVQKLVQHALFRGGFDPNAVAESDAPLKRKTRDCPTSSDPSKEIGGSSTKFDDVKERSSTEGRTKSAKADDRLSQLAKKRCIANKSNANGDNKYDSADSIPVGNMKQENGKAKKDMKRGPHGDVLEKLFDDEAKPSADEGEANEVRSMPRARGESKKKGVRNGGPPKSEGATGKLGGPSSREVASKPVEDAASAFDADDPLAESMESSMATKDSFNQATAGLDGHFGAVSVLLGLMGK